MSDTIIRVEKLGKKYSIHHLLRRGGQNSIREVVTEKFKGLFQRNGEDRNPEEQFWALQDVSFEVKRGEVVGIIGRNGAGKSTLLKILSRITDPTLGRIHLRGRVASLLEVGTGFHGELTGRENIYLNGAILGMSKVEIKSKFDEIVAFSEVEKFLDTPVKRYSSGMYVRLAFAVAAHLEPEILIVDEALAVGDAQFQKKCLGKMQEVSEKKGRTVLFVSHQTAAVSRLCTKGIVMESGRVTFIGPTTEALGRYYVSQNNVDGKSPESQRRPGSGEFRYVSARASQECYAVEGKKTIYFKIKRQAPTNGQFYVSGVVRQGDTNIFQYDSRMLDVWLPTRDEVEGSFSFQQPWLKPGRYSVDLYVCSSCNIVDEFLGGASFTVVEDLPFRGVYDAGAYRLGTVLPDFAIDF